MKMGVSWREKLEKKQEGHIILVSKGKRPPKVKDFEKHLQTI